MKNTFRLLSILLCIVMLVTAFAGCKGNVSGTGTGNGDDGEKFVIPSDLLTEEAYRAEVKKLSEGANLVDADTAAIDKLGDRLRDMIVYNTNDIKDTAGNTYYVSNNGDDKNDGKTPETAWATLTKVNITKFGKDDLVLFERGGLWRGEITAQSDVTYAAYGEGHKPKIYTSIDGMQGEWKETDTPNVYVYSEKIYKDDIGVIVFNDIHNNSTYATKKGSVDKLGKDLDFAFQGKRAKSGKKDLMLYLRCDAGNPQDVFESIEISYSSRNFGISDNSKNIHINNLALYFGHAPFNVAYCDNITMSYCVAGWHGGHYDSGGTRFYGGVCAMPDSDNISVDHCYIYQQFDSGVTPQVSWNTKDPSIFENFVTNDCLFEYCEYTFEYFSTQTDTNENCFKGLYFGYNFCRYGGYGFGDKANASAYVKSWSHENYCYNSTIEYNIFDRPATWSIEVMSYKQGSDPLKKEYFLDFMPTIKNNIYIHRKDRKFANVNNVEYTFNEQTYNTLKGLGFETGARYLFAPEEKK